MCRASLVVPSPLSSQSSSEEFVFPPIEWDDEDDEDLEERLFHRQRLTLSKESTGNHRRRIHHKTEIPQTEEREPNARESLRDTRRTRPKHRAHRSNSRKSKVLQNKSPSGHQKQRLKESKERKPRYSQLLNSEEIKPDDAMPSLKPFSPNSFKTPEERPCRAGKSSGPSMMAHRPSTVDSRQRLGRPSYRLCPQDKSQQSHLNTYTQQTIASGRPNPQAKKISMPPMRRRSQGTGAVALAITSGSADNRPRRRATQNFRRSRLDPRRTRSDPASLLLFQTRRHKHAEQMVAALCSEE